MAWFTIIQRLTYSDIAEHWHDLTNCQELFLLGRRVLRLWT